MMGPFQNVVLICLVAVICGKEKPFCKKEVKISEGSEVTYTEEWGCCAGYTQVAGEELCTECPSWTFGISCRHRCRCDRRKTKYCDHVTGSCVCRRKWTGQTCAIPSYLFRIKRQIPTTTFPPPPTTTSVCNLCNEDGTESCSENTGCQCRSGYEGTSCSDKTPTTPPTTTLPPTEDICAVCIQANTRSCSPNTGCVCSEGWSGVLCETVSAITQTTTRATTTDPCSFCVAENTQNCGSACICNPGWGGQYCADACTEWTYGSGCRACGCSRNTTVSCNVTNGHCTCEAYYWGTNCSNACTDCSSNRLTALSCDDATGKCVCADGYTGSTCIVTCSSFYYGNNCSSKCSCDTQNSRSCDHVTGECYCWPGYTGTNCELLCSGFTYGQNCGQTCQCDVNNTASCDAVGGTCSCNAGWIGTSCNESCPNWMYGVGCNQNCECNQTNTNVCDHVTGQCTCNPGFQGQACGEVCPEYFYGLKCQGECACDKNLSTSCDAVTGECNCISGYDKPHCNTTCSDGFYGNQCATTCACPANAYTVCNHITGACTCRPGYIGDVCQTECPDDSYGVNCLGMCDCLTDHTAYCDKATGVCVCDSGWEGTRCDTASAVASSLTTSLAFWIIIAVVATLMLVFIALFVLWKICRCSCTEVKHRAHRDKGAVILMNSPITPGSNNAAISAMAAATTPLKHDGIYYYSKDLDKPTGADEENPDNAPDSKDTYYYDGIPGAPIPASFGSQPPKPNDKDGDGGEVVVAGAGKPETGKSQSTLNSYQNFSSISPESSNVSTQKNQGLSLPPVPPVPPPVSKMPPPSEYPSNTSEPIPLAALINSFNPPDKIYVNKTAETSADSKPTYTNQGHRLPGLASDDNYEHLDRDTRDTSGVYAELS